MSTPASPTALTVEVDEVDDQSIVRVRGPLLIGTAWQVRELDTSGIEQSVLIDLAETTDIDIAGIAAVGGLARALMATGHRVHIIEPVKPHLGDTVAMTGVFQLINQRCGLASAR